MARPGVAAPSTNTAVLAVAKKEGMNLIGGLQGEIDALEVTTAEDYLYADTLLGKIKGARRGWAAIWNRINEGTVKPLREALENTYQVNRDVDGPMEQGEKKIKRLMEDYKREEARQLRAAEEEREREARRLDEEIRRKEEQAQKASTPQMRGKLARQAEALKEEQAEVITTVRTAVVGANSTTRMVDVAKVLDYPSFFQGLSDGDFEPDEKFYEAIGAFVERARKAGDPVSDWGGCTVVKEPQIAGRR